jgi:DNA-binding NtrC family response regulator
VYIIKVSALNDRRDDIPWLLEHFLQKLVEEQGNAQNHFHPKL